MEIRRLNGDLYMLKSDSFSIIKEIFHYFYELIIKEKPHKKWWIKVFEEKRQINISYYRVWMFENKTLYIENYNGVGISKCREELEKNIFNIKEKFNGIII